MMKLQNRFFIGLLIIGSLLIIIRLSLPYILIRYATQQINKIPEYQVVINDIDVYLWKGSYAIKGLALNKVKGRMPVPFFSAKQIHLSIEWKALFKGSLVAKAEAFEPVLNFVVNNNGDEQISISDEWEYAAKKLFPLNFNKITIHDGKISLHKFQSKAPFHLSLSDIQFEIINMQKVIKSNGLFSTFEGNGKMYGGNFHVQGRVDPLNKVPTFILKSSLKSMQIQQANDFLLHFTHFDVKKGEFSLFVELAAAKGKITGYAKPIIKHLQIFNPKEPTNPVKFIYKGFLELGAKLITNHRKQTIATKINIKGDLDNPKTSLLSIIGYILRHAFIQALLPQIDNTVEMRDIVLPKN